MEIRLQTILMIASQSKVYTEFIEKIEVCGLWYYVVQSEWNAVNGDVTKAHRNAFGKCNRRRLCRKTFLRNPRRMSKQKSKIANLHLYLFIQCFGLFS